MFVIDNNNSRFFDKFYPSKLKTLQQNLNQNRRRGLRQTVRELLYPAINLYPLYRDFREIVRKTTLKLGTHHATFVGPTIVVCRDDDDDC